MRLETGEEVVGSLVALAKEKNIRMASLSMMGALSHALLGYYTLSEKQYHWKNFDGEFEILGATGNIAMHDDAPMLHLHATLSGSDFAAFGGHVQSATVATTCEIVMTVEEGVLVRTLDEQAGLNLWNLK